MEKAYKLGVIVGRFQVFHNGHKAMIDKAIELCEKVAIFIGSSQESGTEKNPLTYEIREQMLKTVYGDLISIYPLPDVGMGNNCGWGEYVLNTVKTCCGEYPDIAISGKESRRSAWYANEIGEKVTELLVPKTIDISASRMREYLLKGDRKSWLEYTDAALADEFDTLREAVVASLNNKVTSSI